MNKLNLSFVCFLLLTQVSCATNLLDGPLVTVYVTVSDDTGELLGGATRLWRADRSPLPL